MATVPTAFNSGLGQQQSASNATPYQSLSTSPATFGAGIGAGIERLGKGAMDFTVAYAARQRAIEDENDKAAVGRAMMAVRKDTEARLLGDIYAKPSSEIFANGASPVAVFQNSDRYFQDGMRSGESMLANDRQKQLFSQQFGQYRQSEENRLATHLGTQHRSYLKEVSGAQKVDAEDYLGGLASAIEGDWRQADRLRTQGHMQITVREGMGLSEADANELRIEWEDYVSASAVRGWFSEQTNRLGAAEALLTGQISDPDVKKMWDSLDAKQRKTVRTDLISQAQKLAQFSNDQRRAAEDARKEAADRQVSDFFNMTDEADRAQRVEIYEGIKNNPDVSLPIKNAMRDTLFGGAITHDNAEGVRALEEAIYRGDIRSIEDANAFRYNDARPATEDTMRGRVYPLIQQMNNRDFASALQAGRASLGIVEGVSITNQVVSQRAGYFESAYRRHMAANPDANPWEVSRDLEEKARNMFKVDTATMGMLQSIKKGYDDAIAAGDTIRAATERQRADALLNVLGLTWDDIK